MTTSNGFPVLTVHDLADAWKIGNMALAWAKEPLALDPTQLEMFNDLCKRYGLEPSEVLYTWQKIAFPDLLRRKLEASRAAHGEMPEISGGGVPYPSPQPRHSGDPGEQSLVETAVIAPPSGTPLPEMNCGQYEEAHPDHNWEQGEDSASPTGEWFYCDGQPSVAFAGKKKEKK
jgi:hypothetical protein